MKQQYAVGIDLGTSNSALALLPIDANNENDNGSTTADAHIVPITQLVSAQAREGMTTLPSAVYLPTEQEQRQLPEMPWQEGKSDYVIGSFARKHGALLPDRLITSAKSWLCNNRIDPKQPLLPWQSSLAERKMSPFDTQVAILKHLRQALLEHCRHNEIHLDLDNTPTTITVPASFDEVAKNLTAAAAQKAGWSETTMLEEQQAAFYNWLDQCGDSWRDQVELGDIILICDIGGGTADFSLIAVAEDNGELQLERISVGTHLLLGGDNMDLALAYALKAELESKGKRIDTGQMLSLIHSCRIAKENLFNDTNLDKFPISIPSRGAGLFSRTLTTNLTRKHLSNIVLDGFFPITTIEEQPLERPRSGLHEAGLNYVHDPVISKHLAHFLIHSQINMAANVKLQKLLETACAQHNQTKFIRPTAVLFNGGIFKAQPLRQRVLDLLSNFNNGQAIRELVTGENKTADLDLSVAKGGAIYSRTITNGSGIRIKAGTARSYYIGIESSLPAIPGIVHPLKALCVVPQGMEEGSEYSLDEREFGLSIGQAVEFRFFSSNVRAADQVGSQVDDADELEETAQLKVTLSSVDENSPHIVPVKLHSRITELGTLELWMQHSESEQRWKIEFNVRGK